MRIARSSFLFILAALLLALTGCNQVTSATTAGGSNFLCQGSGNSFGGCCTGHGGPLTCSSGYYFRSSDGALACGDGSVSGSCFR